jgi:hypothetical protein
MAEDNKNKQQQPQNQINIELSEEIAEGIYSNLAMIAHSNSEFVIDFIRLSEIADRDHPRACKKVPICLKGQYREVRKQLRSH